MINDQQLDEADSEKSAGKIGLPQALGHASVGSHDPNRPKEKANKERENSS